VRGRFGAVLAMALLGPASASAMPSSGPRETVDIQISTARPGASASFTYTATYHAANDPHADPPALRRIVIRPPKGTRIDTTVRPECRATDSDFKNQGDAACPSASRIGAGWVKLKTLGLLTGIFDTTIYNAPRQQAEIAQSGGHTFGVARTYVRADGSADGPVPTCLTGGSPPQGCPFDQVALLSQSLTTRALSTGHGARRRNYLTTQKTCPRSRRWRTPVTLYYADGTVETVVTHQPCVRARAARSHRRPHPRFPDRTAGATRS